MSTILALTEAEARELKQTGLHSKTAPPQTGMEYMQIGTECQTQFMIIQLWVKAKENIAAKF